MWNGSAVERDPATRVRRRAAPNVVFLLLFLLIACLGGCAAPTGDPGGAERPRSIVLVTLDTLRPDHLGCYGYFRDTSPTIDRLAAESIVFERALAPMSATLPSHTSLLTGTYPLEHGVLANIKHGGRSFVPAPGLRSFVEFARDRGYRTGGFVSAAPLVAATGIAAGFDVYREPVQGQRPAEETNAEAFRWIDELGDEPFLLWVHFFDPHQPYRPPEPFRRFGADENLERYLERRRIPETARSFRGRAQDTRESIDLYDGEILYSDRELERLIERLRQAGRWDDSALILVSDHGESIGDHGLIGHEYVTREQLQVLMFLRIPGVNPRRIETPVSLVDALPTAIALLGDPGWEGFLDQASGRDVLAEDAEPRPVLAQRTEKEREDFAGPCYTLLSGDWQYVYEPEKNSRLFDWSADPHELENVIGRHPDVARSLESELLELVSRHHARGNELRGDAETLGDVDPELLEKLRALGYVDD